MTKPITRTITRDGTEVKQALCPGCGLWADVCEDQWWGSVSLDCDGCSYHETHDLSRLGV